MLLDEAGGFGRELTSFVEKQSFSSTVTSKMEFVYLRRTTEGRPRLRYG